MKVYIVVEGVDGGTIIGGVYANYQDAYDHAEGVAEYADFEKRTDEEACWCVDGDRGDVDHDPCVMVMTKDVL